MDYTDIALHGAAAIVVFANAMFWIWRETRQHRDRPWRIFTSWQSFLEWFVPSVIAPIIFAIILKAMAVI